ncbi:MAG: hypothetical protein LBS29_04865 [Endomicrobium sp.]|jgi:hypothetical protein|nr:hypothetical protein [Endomicrobium sp.]
MNINKCFIRNSKVFAVELEEDGNIYPLFLESLINDVICDKLINSGWKLCNFPYDFRKNGVKLSDLPSVVWNPSVEVEQRMWDKIGRELTREELQSRITPAEDIYMKFPEAKYTIFQREDFIKYLNTLKTVRLADDYLPLNYFVHPNALFEYSEFSNPEYAEYFSIIADRRRMSFDKFKKLVAWCLSKGLSENFSPLELVDFYFSWGIDGLNLRYISKEKKERNTYLGAPIVNPEQLDTLRAYETDLCFITKHNEFLLEETLKGKGYRPVVSDAILNDIRMSLGEDEVSVIDIRKVSTQEVYNIQTDACFIQYSSTVLYIGKQEVISFYITGDIASFVVHPQYWNISNWRLLKNDLLLKACTNLILSKMESNYEVSSYLALTRSGCSPYVALSKINNTWKPKTKEVLSDGVDGNLSTIDDNDINAYLRGDDFSGEKTEKLEDIEAILNGDINIDNVDEGQKVDLMVDSSQYYKALLAVNRIFKISASDIYRTVRDIKENQEILSFNLEDKFLRIKLKKLDNKVNGYYKDLSLYRIQQAQQAQEIIYITKIARELGGIKAKRHIACSFMLVKRDAVATIIEKYKARFIEEVELNVVGNRLQQAYINSSKIWAYTALFDIITKGYAKFPDEMGGGTISEEVSVVQNMNRLVTEYVEDIVSLASTNMYPGNEEWRRFYVNATVTPEYIIPHGMHQIPETSLAAVWEPTPLQDTLIKRGDISQNFVYWTYLVGAKSLIYRQIGDSYAEKTTLLYYVTKAYEELKYYPKDKEFIAVTHPLHYLYEGLKQNDNNVDTIEPTTHSFRIGEFRLVSNEDFKSVVDLEIWNREVSGFIQFKGFDADDLFFSEVIPSLPQNVNIDKLITITNGGKTFYTSEFGELPYTEIASFEERGYPVKMIRGRKYVVCDQSGYNYEVTV